MSSQSSFGSRLDNARKVWVHLTTFPDYKGKDQQSVAGFGSFLDQIEQCNKDVATKTEAYSSTTEFRRKNFKGGESSSLVSLASGILSVLRADFDDDSREVATVKAMTNKITGKNGKKAKPTAEETDAAKTNPDSIPKSISKRETGFGNMLKTFADIVATVKSYGQPYAPNTPLLEIQALETRLIGLSDANRNVMATDSALRQILIQRSGLYVVLRKLVKRIKSNVKYQYPNGTEYKLIKGISV